MSHYADTKRCRNRLHSPYSSIAGFTLIELMISLVLGLLISAAVIQVYIINTRTVTVQQSASEVQDSSIFALQGLEDKVRLANMGNPITSINDKTAHGGIVVSISNLGTNPPGYGLDNFTVSAGQSTDGRTYGGPSNTTVGSDKLSIQYKNITPNDMYDCKGGKIEAGSPDWVIESYYVRLATNASTNASGVEDLVLACDAFRNNDAGNNLTGYTNNVGQVITPGVDQFKVLLGVQTDISNITYISSKTYSELTDKPPITTVKLGIIVRSTTPLLTDVDKDTFTVLGSSQSLKTDTTRAKYYRRSYESTILLRNARVMNIIATQPKLASTTTAPGGG